MSVNTARRCRFLAVAAAALGAFVVPTTASASTASLFGTGLSVTGSGTEANNISVTWDSVGNEFVVSDSGAPISPGLGCSSDGANAVRCPDLLGLVSAFSIDAGDGNDVVHVDDATIPSGAGGVTSSTISGGADSDELHGLDHADGADALQGGAGNDTLHGLAGPDALDGGDGTDVLNGGNANDTLVGGASADDFNGGAGANDTVDYSAAAGPVTAAIDPLVASGAGCPGAGCEADIVRADVERLIGSGAGDALTGSAADDTLTGGAGADTLDGGAGGDTLNGGDDGDTLVGAAGNDALNGDAGSDTLDGGDDVDALNGGTENDVLDGGAGADTLLGGGGTDTTTYADRTGAVNVTLDGAANDGDAGDGAATDNVSTENVTGGGGDDTLIGNGVANVLRGGAGNDDLAGGNGADQLLGEDGTDLADYSGDGHTAVTVTLDGATTPNDGNADDGAAGARDTVITENVTGTVGADSLSGDGAANELLGLGGSDTLQGQGAGDTLTGGDGTDTVDYSDRSAAVAVSLDGVDDDGETGESDALATVENITGGGGADDLTGDAAVNVIQGGGGDDTLAGAGGADQLLGDSGTDVADYSSDGHTGVTVTLDGSGTPNDGDALDGGGDVVATESVTGTGGVDVLTGDGGANALLGLGGNDTITGLGGNDQLDGGDGVDGLDGGNDDDVLHGGASGTTDDGGDTIAGSVGNDTVTYAGRTDNVDVSLDGVANDGAAGENDQVSQVENATGGDGDDVLSGTSAANVLEGGTGNDTATYAGRTENLTLSLDGAPSNDGALCGAGESPCEGDTLHSSVENVEGGDGNDTITGNAQSNVIDGGAGDDAIDSVQTTEDPDGVFCGAGSGDSATADEFDVVDADCETIDQADFPSLSVDDQTTAESDSGTHTATFTAMLSRAVGYTVTVDYDTLDGTATAGADYDAASGTLTFAPGETTKPIAVTVNGDGDLEDDETFTVELSAPAPTGVTLADATGAGTITNDDVAGSLSIGDVSVTEGDSGKADATFTVTRAAGSAGAVSVTAASADGSATVADGDYDALAGTVVSFAAGETSKTVTVKVNGDTAFEGDETFTVLLSGATGGATIADGTGVGTIKNDDAAPVAPALTISDVRLAEGASGASNATFAVALSKPATEAVSARYSTRNGSATAGSDYAASTGTVTFAPGETSKTVAVPVAGDKRAERDETFGVILTEATGGATIAKALGIGLIANDDVACVVPRTKGRTLARATRALTAARCTVGKRIRRYSSSVKRGRIVKSSPPAGMSLDQDAPVALVISKGRRPSRAG